MPWRTASLEKVLTCSKRDDRGQRRELKGIVDVNWGNPAVGIAQVPISGLRHVEEFL